MDYLQDRILQYVISGQYAEDQGVAQDILDDPSFDQEEFDTLKTIFELSDGLRDYQVAAKDEAWQNILAETGLNRSYVRPLWQRWAAAAVILIAAGAALYLFWPGDPYVTYLAATDERKMLPDESAVDMSAGAQIRYLDPELFLDESSREVFLDGEARFVVKEMDKPFVVRSEHTFVDVLGTTFRYHARGEFSESENEEGRVRFGTNDGTEVVILDPGDKASHTLGAPIELIKFEPPEEPPPPPPPPSNKLRADDLLDILAYRYPTTLIMASGAPSNAVVVDVSLGGNLRQILVELDANPNVSIDYEENGNRFELRSLIGIPSGLNADYSYLQFQAGVPYQR